MVLLFPTFPFHQGVVELIGFLIKVAWLFRGVTRAQLDEMIRGIYGRGPSSSSARPKRPRHGLEVHMMNMEDYDDGAYY